VPQPYPSAEADDFIERDLRGAPTKIPFLFEVTT